MSAISNDWLEPLSPEFKKPYYAKLYKTVKEEYSTQDRKSTRLNSSHRT